MKNVLILVLAGALLGVIAASYIAPPMLSWYTTPGGLPQGAQVQALVQIPDVVCPPQERPRPMPRHQPVRPPARRQPMRVL